LYLHRALGSSRARELATTLHVVVTLAFVELVIRFVPLPVLARALGVRINLGPSNEKVEPIRANELSTKVRRQLRCTRRMTELWPLSRGPCLRRSLVGGHLLRDERPTIRLGTAGTGDSFVVHAWLEIGGRPLEQVAGFRAFEQRPAGSTP
jgi:hypothetical protein